MDTNLADDLAALKAAQPSFKADTLGVRGNPVEFHRQQANVDWPPATLSHRGHGVELENATPGAPSPAPSVTAT